MTRGKLSDNRISNHFINHYFNIGDRGSRGKEQRATTRKYDVYMHHDIFGISGDGDMAMMIKTIKFTLHPSRVRKGKAKSTAPIARSEYAELYFDKGAGWNVGRSTNK